MPVVKFGVGSKAVDAEPEGFQPYDGPMPPKGIYNVIVKRLRLKKNRNDDWMLNGIAEISEPGDNKKSKYNGYTTWVNQNITEQGSGYVNAMLDGLSGGNRAVRKAFWLKGAKTDNDKKTPYILAIGPMKVDQNGMPARVSLIDGKDQNGNHKMDVGSWLPLKKKKSRDEDDEDEDFEEDLPDDEDEDEDDLDLEDEEDDDEDDEEDEDDEDEEDEDEEDEDEEPEPPKSKKKRKKVDDEPPF